MGSMQLRESKGVLRYRKASDVLKVDVQRVTTSQQIFRNSVRAGPFRDAVRRRRSRAPGPGRGS